MGITILLSADVNVTEVDFVGALRAEFDGAFMSVAQECVGDDDDRPRTWVAVEIALNSVPNHDWDAPDAARVLCDRVLTTIVRTAPGCMADCSAAIYDDIKWSSNSYCKGEYWHPVGVTTAAAAGPGHGR